MLLPRWTGPLLMFAGLGLIAVSIVRGSAHLALVVIVPVVTGSSAEFFVGVLLLVSGIFCLPLAFSAGNVLPTELPRIAAEAPESDSSSGGLLLVGPIPIFFGAWKNARAAWFWIAVAVGAVVSLALVLFVLVY